ncbi:MAG TPA: FkbM family methyltransferase [Thermoanaerobaculia bacterium]|nr:FkbM family methyltransferase [Thermoanaerobaculia bacterium]
MSMRTALAHLVPHHGLAFRLARKIVNLHHGDNDFDFQTNGELRVMRTVLPHCRVVFDIGANVGEWTELALTINPNLQIHCFEPSAATFARLSALNLPANVTRNHFGLGSEAEERTLFVYAEGSGANSVHFRIGTPAAPIGEERISLRTFDDYTKDEVDFVKIDVEGNEVAVLRGASNALRAGRIGVVQFEYGGAYIDARVLLKDIFELVENLNRDYSFFKIFPDGPRPVPRYVQTLETFQYSNWLIARKDWVARLGSR